MKDDLLEFYVNKFCYLDNTQADVSFIEPISRRRMSPLDKIALSVMNKAFTDDIQNIIFASQFGQCERLFKMINQYKEDKEVSPSAFSSSVHNYSAGFFLLNIKKPIPYSALSSMESTIENGLLSSVISNFNNVLFCYCDIYNNNNIAFAINLSKTPKKESTKYVIKMQKNNETASFEKYVELFEGKIDSIKNPLYVMERACI